MYFEKFPKIEYDGTVIADVSIRYKINELVRDSVNTYELYRLSDGEKPEDVAYRIYGSVSFHWVILLMNDITDPIGEWFRSDQELTQYIELLYGIGNGGDVHHYEDADGYVINEYQDANTVTYSNTDYEEAINDGRREIKVLRPEYLYQLINEFESSIK